MKQDSSNFAWFLEKCWKTSKNAGILLPLNCNFSGLGWCDLDFSKSVGQGGFGLHSESKLVSQFMQTKFLCHKMSQNSTVFPVSYSRDCRYPNLTLKVENTVLKWFLPSCVA